MMRRPRLKNVTVVAVALVLAALGSYNIFLKATWTLMDDGVLWTQGPEGVYAARLAPGGPAALAAAPAGHVVPPVPARRFPAVLPLVPGAALARFPRLGDPRRLHARAGARGRRRGQPGPVRDGTAREPRGALADHRRHRRLEAA